MDWQLIGIIIAGAGGVITAISQLTSARRGQRRQVTEGLSIVDASEDVVNLYRTTLSDLRQEMAQLREDHKASQEALEAHQDKTDELVGALRAELGDGERRIKRLEDELRRVKNSLRHYRDGVDILIGQLRRLGHSPEWTPSTEFINKD